MEIELLLDKINSFELDQRVSYVNDLIKIASSFIEACDHDVNVSLGLKILNCIEGIRSSRFVESDIDLELIEISIKIARKIKDNKSLKSLLKSLLYYSNYFPGKYVKSEIENELKEL
jgi:hypothetical protein